MDRSGIPLQPKSEFVLRLYVDVVFQLYQPVRQQISKDSLSTKRVPTLSREHLNCAGLPSFGTSKFNTSNRPVVFNNFYGIRHDIRYSILF